MKKVLVVLCMLLSLVGCGSNAKYNVGILQFTQHEALDKATEGFKDVLIEEFGNDIAFNYQNASGDTGTCLIMATDLVSDNVDLIMANATPALQSVANATNNIPVLGTSITEYGVALYISNFDGLVGTNISGTSDLAPLDEQAQMILDLFPNTKKVGIIYCIGEANSKYQVETVSKYLQAKGIEVNSYSFSDSNDVNNAAVAACDESDVIYIPTDNTCASNGGLISNVASKKNIPIITGEKDTLLAVNGLATLSIDYYELGRTTGKMAAKILKGESKVSEMPIEYYANPVKMYQKEVADRYGLTMSEEYIEIEE